VRRCVEHERRLRAAEQGQLSPARPTDTDATVKAGDLVEVTVVEAAHLPKANLIFGTIDPYFVVKIGAKVCKTKRLKNNPAPVFGDSFIFTIEPNDTDIHVVLKDQQTFGANQRVAECFIPLSTIAGAGLIDNEYQLLKHDAPVRGIDGSTAVIHLRLEHKTSRPSPPLALGGGSEELRAAAAKLRDAEQALQRANANLAAMVGANGAPLPQMTAGGVQVMLVYVCMYVCIKRRTLLQQMIVGRHARDI
jgi:hypothetical protein